MSTDKFITARARAFSDEKGPQQHEFMVSLDAIRVYDPIAQHYTLCHCLTESAKRRIRKLATNSH